MQKPSLSFDRVAHEYDETRGGEGRGRAFAEHIAPLLASVDGPVLEVGIGTGVIALGLRDHGVEAVGVDISPEMLARARERLGLRVAVGDATLLPVRDRSVAAAYSVWVLHLVGNQLGLLREVRRVVRPGGRYVVVTPDRTHVADDDVSQLCRPLEEALGRPGRDDLAEVLTPIAVEAGFEVESVGGFASEEFAVSPRETADRFERRTWSRLWEIDDEQWQSLVVPTIEAVRALPDQDLPRARTTRQVLLTLRSPA